MNGKKQKKLNYEELALFCEQFAMTLDAGLNHMDGISVMLEDAMSEDGKVILETILGKLHEGLRLNESMEATGVFPKYCLDMIRIGETSGKLDEVMHSLSFHYTREQNISEGIKNSLKYPFIIIGMMFIVILVLVIKVLPIFNQVFVQLGSEMTGFSRSMMQFGSMIGTYSVVFISILIVLISLYWFFLRTENGKAKFASFCSRFFLTRALYEKIAVGRFASGMALTLNAGLRPEESLEMVSTMVDNENISKRIDTCLDLVRRGGSFSASLVEAGIFNNLYSRMIAVSGKSGTVDKALEKIATKYDEEVDSRISNIISILEPTLVIVFSIVVCMILLSVMLPLMSIMTSIG
ncbi:MAG: type II secretion system F family protein [Lachnospiraceae bacterium]|nr:type II secretion system F family protein [Lachnospiraceae bacterium]